MDERGRRPHRLLRVAGCDRRREGRDSRARRPRPRARLQCRRSARDGARGRLRRADADLRHAPRARPFARPTSRTSASTACAPASSRRPANASIHTPLLGRGNLANVLAATAVALEFDVPLDDIVAAAARLKPADRRGAVRRLRGGIVLIDDSYNSSPAALAARARRRRPRDAGVDGRWPCSARCSSSASTRWRCTASRGTAAAAAGLRLLFVDWRRAGARARRCGGRGRHAGVGGALRREERGRGARRSPPPSRRATSCWSRDRAARARTSWPTALRRSSPDAVSTCCRRSNRTSAC